MSSKKKKRIILALGLGFLCIITGFGWYTYKENQRFSPVVSNPNPRFEDLVLIETGNGSKEDICLVIEKNTADIWRYYIHFRVIPGKYVFFTEREGKVEELTGDAYREKFYWDYIQTNVYEIATGNFVQSINVKALHRRKCTGIPV